MTHDTPWCMAFFFFCFCWSQKSRLALTGYAVVQVLESISSHPVIVIYPPAFPFVLLITCPSFLVAQFRLAILLGIISLRALSTFCCRGDIFFPFFF